MTELQHVIFERDAAREALKDAYSNNPFSSESIVYSLLRQDVAVWKREAEKMRKARDWWRWAFLGAILGASLYMIKEIV